eukprot:scaffold6.g2599.t1
MLLASSLKALIEALEQLGPQACTWGLEDKKLERGLLSPAVGMPTGGGALQALAPALTPQAPPMPAGGWAPTFQAPAPVPTASAYGQSVYYPVPSYGETGGSGQQRQVRPRLQQPPRQGLICTLWDGYLQDGDFQCTLDDKSGYHHVAVHPDSWRYLCFEWDSTVWCWTVEPFGLSSAVRTYTVLAAATSQLLRAHGEETMHYIDDRHLASRSRELACFHVRTCVLLKASLGFFASLSKGDYWPEQTVCCLGMLLSTVPSCRYEVPADKLDYVLASVRQLLQQGTASPRRLAQVAGQLLSLKPAYPMTSLYTRSLYQLATAPGGAGWDTPRPLPEDLRADLLRFEPRLDSSNPLCANGHRLRKRASSCCRLTLVANSSDQAHAGVARLQTAAGTRELQLVLPYSEQQYLLSRCGSWSSTAQETVGTNLMLRGGGEPVAAGGAAHDCASEL